ncbi:SMP-30/gluconolactonase/LRE family protein [Novosphingobium colocasiae]
MWVAFWDGGCIRQLDRTGRIIAEVALPVRRPTSIAFADPTHAFVTSAATGLSRNALDGTLLSVRWC